MKKHRPLIYAMILIAINFLIFLISDKEDSSAYSSSNPPANTPTVTATVTPSVKVR